MYPAPSTHPSLQKLADSEFIIEATDDEQFLLWVINDKEKNYKDWQQDSMGYWQQIGTIGDLPVCASISFAKIDGLRVAFVSMTSRAHDYEMLEEWVKFYCKATYDNGRRAATNAMNFHHINRAIKEPHENRIPIQSSL